MNKSEKFWDRMAKYLDRVERKDEATNIKIIEKTRKYLKINDTVLDFGCGTGTAAIEIAGSVKKVTGIDISSKMIEAAKGKTVEGKVKNIDFTQTTIFDEKLKTGSFDVILCFHLLHLVEDTPKVMQRINELLKPGGLIISATPCIRGTFLGVLLWPVSKIGLIPPIKYYNISELEDLMTEGNFEIVETECLDKSGQQYFIVAKKKGVT
ncbi:MAG: ubiquinone/menaquinone biosynthesis methyltransferase [Candidatus Methanoperedens nitroreducens]|uniref:Ubiquinone/menaquinone biosynthesis methyltransferase n=1 Tax=Candidatus Methanoperedens nitratireducens TaxID=1392998 RepID=A0A0P8A529_9EURY|nr:class I SAM-dependent methyltransferase [Candidatus Methanoperedens sp. BLZ2]KAB2947253.1 MAG: methyltransferase domain-containing protein [Candidatus Methanoperedens sp.]KPQ43251.1 MAG: ubiquinone/menaquinone biosynthesis methyltransferase [Candidatus Methanoperedens sp. BLZ1]MBZ0175396.1 methyltransferase domain-containing protein [Candidatus Methanoperedens nitroreducens]CAG0990610.1 demethylmenaquinone methyltransferase / 2-methoxy-6-polyprenyl-1,4-benzoquinol methylase [Methanosarcinale